MTITQTQAEFLNRTYVMVIENTGTYRRVLDQYVRAGEFRAFLTYTCKYIDIINRQRDKDDDLPEETVPEWQCPKRRVAMQLWDNLEGKHTVDYEDSQRSVFSAPTAREPKPQPLSPEPTKAPEIMTTTTVAFETVNYVYGRAVKDMTEEQLIAAIKQVEDEIAKLETVKTTSKKITAKIEALKKMLASIVESLDAL